MRDISLNILEPAEIIRLKAVLNEVVLAVPKQHRSSAMQACVAEQLLKLAAGGEKDPIKLRESAMLVSAAFLVAQRTGQENGIRGIRTSAKS